MSSQKGHYAQGHDARTHTSTHGTFITPSRNAAGAAAQMSAKIIHHPRMISVVRYQHIGKYEDVSKACGDEGSHTHGEGGRSASQGSWERCLHTCGHTSACWIRSSNVTGHGLNRTRLSLNHSKDARKIIVHSIFQAVFTFQFESGSGKRKMRA